MSLAIAQLTSKGIIHLLDLVASGEAAQMCGFIDGRTFLKWAQRYGLEPEAKWGVKLFYKRSDVEKMASKIKDT